MRYGTETIDADRETSYFDKLVQIPVRVPRPGPNEVKCYIMMLLTELAVQQGRLSEDEVYELEKCACPGAGSCSGLFTANTMACISETLGLSLPTCATTHARTEENNQIAFKSGRQIIKLVEEDIKPSDILTQESFNNAIAVDMALGGSSNTALHIPAMASEVENLNVDLELFDQISRNIPHIALISPAGEDSMMDLHLAGGIQAVLKTLGDKIDTNQLTVTGKTIAENLKNVENKNVELLF